MLRMVLLVSSLDSRARAAWWNLSVDDQMMNTRYPVTNATQPRRLFSYGILEVTVDRSRVLAWHVDSTSKSACTHSTGDLIVGWFFICGGTKWLCRRRKAPKKWLSLLSNVWKSYWPVDVHSHGEQSTIRCLRAWWAWSRQRDAVQSDCGGKLLHHMLMLTEKLALIRTIDLYFCANFNLAGNYWTGLNRGRV